jgi:hypothetical protein
MRMFRICAHHPDNIWVNKSRRMRWAEQVAYVGEEKVHTGKLEGRKPIGRIRQRWEDNFKMDRK